MWQAALTFSENRLIQKQTAQRCQGPLLDISNYVSVLVDCEPITALIIALSLAEDFPAHAGNVNCIKIGTKSSGVLVTGGDDKKVNLWTIGAQTKALVRINI